MRDLSHRRNIFHDFPCIYTIYRGMSTISVLAAYDFLGRRNPYCCIR